MSRLPARMRVDRGERAAATPETIAKHRPDLLLRLHSAGFLRDSEVVAGREIRAMWSILCPILRRGRGDPLGLAQATVRLRERTGGYHDGLTARGEWVHQHVWMPWSRQCSHRVAGLPEVTLLQLVLDLVVDNTVGVGGVSLPASALRKWSQIRDEAINRFPLAPAGRAAAPARSPRA